MNQDRWKEIEVKKLEHGSHNSLENGACIMELVSYIANEPWSDHPKCACPILTEYAISLNDHFNDEHRQLLKPFIPLLLNTKSTDKVRIKRKQLLMWSNVTQIYPIILDVIKLPGLAQTLRLLPNTVEGMEAAKALLLENKKIIYANAYANTYANANANAYAYAYAGVDAYANAYVYAYADVDAYANANANVYAYADVDVDVDACVNAQKIREEICSAAIKVLHLAIEIKE